jgi:hypothetical protein
MIQLTDTPWLPIAKERHRWSERWRDVECPHFPGYLFARATNADWQQILRTPGVLTVIKDGVLRGVRGIVRERRSGRQLVLCVAEIGRGVAFTIGPALVNAA